MGLNFAAAFTAFDNELEYSLDPSYGTLNFVVNEWGAYQDGSFFSKVEEIPSHICSKDELGIEGESSSFMPVDKQNLAHLKTYQKKFRCVDKE